MLFEMKVQSECPSFKYLTSGWQGIFMKAGLDCGMFFKERRLESGNKKINIYKVSPPLPSTSSLHKQR